MFYNIALTASQLDDARSAVARARRLQKFIKKNEDLGLLEEKDLLWADAQVKQKLSDYKTLEVLYEQQRIQLNKLMGLPVTHEFEPVVQKVSGIKNIDSNLAYTAALANNTDIMILQSQIKLAESEIKLAEDALEEQLDLILSIGTVSTSGDITAGSFSNDEVVGGLRLEYQYDFDKRDVNASSYQARLQRQIYEEQLRKAKYDLKYDVKSSRSQLKIQQQAMLSHLQYLQVENAKVRDVEKRYKQGRADTREVIDTENTQYFSKLRYERQKIELAKAYALFRLTQGELWDESMIQLRSNQQESDQ